MKHSYLPMKKFIFLSNLTELQSLMLLEPVHSEMFQYWVECSSIERKVLVSRGKFQAVLLDKNPGRFSCRQVVVLQHAAPRSGIIFAVYFNCQNAIFVVFAINNVTFS